MRENNFFFSIWESQRKWWEKVWNIFINWKWIRENSREEHQYLSKYNSCNHIILFSYSLFQYSFCICLFFLIFLIHFLPFCKLFYLPRSQDTTLSACANMRLPSVSFPGLWPTELLWFWQYSARNLKIRLIWNEWHVKHLVYEWVLKFETVYP